MVLPLAHLSVFPGAGNWRGGRAAASFLFDEFGAGRRMRAGRIPGNRARCPALVRGGARSNAPPHRGYDGQ